MALSANLVMPGRLARSSFLSLLSFTSGAMVCLVVVRLVVLGGDGAEAGAVLLPTSACSLSNTVSVARRYSDSTRPWSPMRHTSRNVLPRFLLH
jgi:hypothetical protein